VAPSRATRWPSTKDGRTLFVIEAEAEADFRMFDVAKIDRGRN
jgi:hypothetical protein